MRDRLLFLLPSVLALSFATLILMPALAAAQSDGPTVLMQPESAGPGATVEVTGLDFPRNSTVALRLSTPDGPVNLKTVATSGGGDFRDVVTLPSNVAAGGWELQARAANGTSASYVFGSGDPAPVDASGTTTSTQTAGNSMSDIIFMLIVASVLGVLLTGILFAYRLMQDERTQPGMGTGDDLIWADETNEASSEPQPTVPSDPHWKRPAPESEPASTEGAPAAEQEARASA